MRRIWLVVTFFIIIFIIISVRLFYWQVLSSYHLQTEASSQYTLQMTLPARRGEIVTADGYPLVMNKTAYLVYAEPKNIQNPMLFSKAVADVLGVPEASIAAKLTDRLRMWMPIQHKTGEEKTQALKKLGLVGLGFQDEPARYYPEASLAAHLIGFVGSDQNGLDTGYFGLEGYYNRVLAGKPGSLEIEKDAAGAPILIGNSRRIEAEHGSTLHLHIDRTIQTIAETRLIEGIEKYGAKEGTVTIMDPATGGILAMASYPSYDPKNFIDYDKTVYKNPIVASSYEPGSTFKPLIVAAAIDKGLIKATSNFDESGPVQVGDYAIRTWNNQYHGVITINQVLEYSSNVGMVYIEKLIGKDALLSFIKGLGVGKPTNVDLEDEDVPEVRSDKDWMDIDLATASFGQGIALTPLQVVRAIASIANGGWLMEPHIVASIEQASGKKSEIKPKKIKQVMSSSTAGTLTEMMVDAVDNGEAKFAKPKGYRIAGKTGTAQIPVAGHYDTTKTIASFVGFAPADRPKFVMLVTLREPSSSQWGAETAAPLFFTIAKDIFLYLGIPSQ